jgi:hypothetical protein
MNKIQLAPYCIVLTVGNCIVPFQIGRVADFMRAIYAQGLGAYAALPGATIIALAIPPWLYVCTGLSILASAIFFSRRVSGSLLAHLLLCLCVLECAGLFFFALGICIPFASIMWGAGK